MLSSDQHVPYLKETVFFAELDRLLPSVVAFVEVGGDSAELDQLVLLHAESKHQQIMSASHDVTHTSERPLLHTTVNTQPM